MIGAQPIARYAYRNTQLVCARARSICSLLTRRQRGRRECPSVRARSQQTSRCARAPTIYALAFGLDRPTLLAKLGRWLWRLARGKGRPAADRGLAHVCACNRRGVPPGGAPACLRWVLSAGDERVSQRRLVLADARERYAGDASRAAVSRALEADLR